MDHPVELLEIDDLLDHAYEIFLELASDNLSEEQITLFNAEFADRGALGDSTPDDDWQEYVDFAIDPALHVEVCVGLVNADEEFDVLFARMLLSRDAEDRRCQIQWHQ